jgi:hypothetical protein
MNIRTLRTSLEATLASQLGAYTYANGATTPAIAARAWGEALPPRTTVSGMECLIIRNPELDPIVKQYRDEVAFQKWTIFLVDWGGAVDLHDAASRLLWAYPGSETSVVQAPQSVGPKAWMRVELTTSPDFVFEAGDAIGLIYANTIIQATTMIKAAA